MTTRIETDLDMAALSRWVDERTPSALFATVSGAHLYGFPSVDSDVDVRGSFLAPLAEVVGLVHPAETVDPKDVLANREVEAVFHEIGKYFRLLVKHNGYILEQIFSPIVLTGGEFLTRLRPLAARCVTRNCFHHYRGFLSTQRNLLEKEKVKKAKSILYAYRVVLTGIHLLRTGEVESHLPTLNEELRFEFIPELIERKKLAEFGCLNGLNYSRHVIELDRLGIEMERAYESSSLPTHAPVDEAHRFLVELRLNSIPCQTPMDMTFRHFQMRT
ncbi:MAG TPA: nucleotidyltransferase domain-containing protein [Fimbriiglobus sp.]|jgi:hypothetical protein